jgi:hypothetical protein
MKKHDYVRSNLTYWLDDKTQSQVYNFLQKIPRKQAVFVSLLVHKYLSENYDGQLEDITAKDADWIYKWLLLKQHADDMGLAITPYKHIFKKIVELQPEASIETIWNIYTTIAAVSDEDKHTSSSLPNVSNIDSALDDSEPSMSDKSDPSVPTSDSSVSHENSLDLSNENVSADPKDITETLSNTASNESENNTDTDNENIDYKKSDTDDESDDDDDDVLNINAVKALSGFKMPG